jgi:hypothetical protein
MRYATKFVDDALKIQREYYLGKIQHETALMMMGELMRHHRVLSVDEILVDVPDCFRTVPQTGFFGEFTIRKAGSTYTWKRSFARNMPRNVYCDQSNEDFPAERPHRHYTSPALRKVAALPLPLMTDKDREFFAPYEKQMETK